jgi:hypothetical protein
MTTVFENPANGYRVKVDTFTAWLWTSIFGPFFFLFRGNILHFFLWFLVGGISAGAGIFIYPFFAANILRRTYYERGYRVVEQRPTDGKTFLLVAAVLLVPPIGGFVLLEAISSSYDRADSRNSQQSKLTQVQPTFAPSHQQRFAEPHESSDSTENSNSKIETPEAESTKSDADRQQEQLYFITGVAKDDMLNIRSGPGANYPTVGRLPATFGGIRIIEGPVMSDTEWVRISFGGQSGWVAQRYLAPQPRR